MSAPGYYPLRELSPSLCIYVVSPWVVRGVRIQTRLKVTDLVFS